MSSSSRFRVISPTLELLLFSPYKSPFVIQTFLMLFVLEIYSDWLSPVNLVLWRLGKYKVRKKNKPFQWPGLSGKYLFKIIISYLGVNCKPGPALSTLHKVTHLTLTTLYFIFDTILQIKILRLQETK